MAYTISLTSTASNACAASKAAIVGAGNGQEHATQEDVEIKRRAACTISSEAVESFQSSAVCQTLWIKTCMARDEYLYRILPGIVANDTRFL